MIQTRTLACFFAAFTGALPDGTLGVLGVERAVAGAAVRARAVSVPRHASGRRRIAEVLQRAERKPSPPGETRRQLISRRRIARTGTAYSTAVSPIIQAVWPTIGQKCGPSTSGRVIWTRWYSGL